MKNHILYLILKALTASKIKKFQNKSNLHQQLLFFLDIEMKIFIDSEKGLKHKFK